MKSIDAQPGDLLLFTHAKKANRLITWFTQSPYYHVALFEGGTSVIEARPRGVVRRDLNGPDGDKDFVVLPAPSSRRQARQALKWAQSQLGQGYDPLNVASLVLDRTLICFRVPSLKNDRYSCGELVAKAFQNADVELFPDIDAEDVLPADFSPFLPPDTTHHKEPDDAAYHEPESENALDREGAKVPWVFIVSAFLLLGVWAMLKPKR